jgi:hypothetical protein
MPKPAGTIQQMRELAESRGGRCLSAEYLGSGAMLEWACTHGHTWTATPNNVKNRHSWCPRCRSSAGEEQTRAALEAALPGASFERTRALPWLGGLELDGYCAAHALAFEYHGAQHCRFIPHFHGTPKKFAAQLARDLEKQRRCAEAKVRLITVAHTVRDIGAFVNEALSEST